MTQIRYHNYLRPLDSYDENSRFLGLIQPGVYAGFDRATVSGNQVTLSHTVTGIRKPSADNLTNSSIQGCIVSPHGVAVYEDTPIQVLVAANASNQIRTDLIIMELEWVDSDGGQVATYSVLQGPANGNDAVLNDPKRQAIIGKFKVPPSSTNISHGVYYKQSARNLGGGYASSYRVGEGQTIPESPTNFLATASPLKNIDTIIENGLWSVSTNSLASAGGDSLPLGDEPTYLLEVIIREPFYIQRYTSIQDANPGFTYFRRGFRSGGTMTWTSWKSTNALDAITQANLGISSLATSINSALGDKADKSVEIQTTSQLYIDQPANRAKNLAGAPILIGIEPGALTAENIVNNQVVKTPGSSSQVFLKVFDLGPWNMENTSVVSVNLEGINETKIISASAVIRKDVGVASFPNSRFDLIGRGGSWSTLNTLMIVNRDSNSIFVSTPDFTSTANSRGTLTIWYTS